jgi:hypothetical protein
MRVGASEASTCAPRSRRTQVGRSPGYQRAPTPSQSPISPRSRGASCPAPKATASPHSLDRPFMIMRRIRPVSSRIRLTIMSRMEPPAAICRPTGLPTRPRSRLACTDSECAPNLCTKTTIMSRYDDARPRRSYAKPLHCRRNRRSNAKPLRCRRNRRSYANPQHCRRNRRSSAKPLRCRRNRRSYANPQHCRRNRRDRPAARPHRIDATAWRPAEQSLPIACPGGAGRDKGDRSRCFP